MSAFIWLFYIICGIFLFIFIELLKRKFKVNLFQKLFLSILFMLIVASVCSRYGFNDFNSNIFLIFVFEMICKIFYSNYFLEKDFFDRSDHNVLYFFILVVVGYLINIFFINRVQYVYLSGQDLKIMIWFVMILFIYEFFKDNKVLQEFEGKNVKKRLGREAVLINYAKLKNKYSDEVNNKNNDINNIVYSIMIFNNHQRPKFYRNVDNFKFRFNGTAKSLGIMQIKSKKFITDEESIEIVNKKISKLSEKFKKNRKIDNDNVIKSYDKENYEEIIYVYNIISNF